MAGLDEGAGKDLGRPGSAPDAVGRRASAKLAAGGWSRSVDCADDERAAGIGLLGGDAGLAAPVAATGEVVCNGGVCKGTVIPGVLTTAAVTVGAEVAATEGGPARAASAATGSVATGATSRAAPG